MSMILTSILDEGWTVHADGRRVIDANGLVICRLPEWADAATTRVIAAAIAQLPALLTYVRDGMGGPGGTRANGHWARGDILDYVDGMTTSADYLGAKLGLDQEEEQGEQAQGEEERGGDRAEEHANGP